MTVSRFNFRVAIKSEKFSLVLKPFEINQNGYILYAGDIDEICKKKEYCEDEIDQFLLSIGFRYQEEVEYYIKSDFEFLVQSLGITDKNGKEIFEGDIILDDFKDKVIVEYSHVGFDLQGYMDWRDLVDANSYPWDEMEVIGNIYEDNND